MTLSLAKTVGPRLSSPTTKGRGPHVREPDLQALDKAIVLAAVNQNGLALEHADVALKCDATIVVAAVNQHGWALLYADETRRDILQVKATAPSAERRR